MTCIFSITDYISQAGQIDKQPVRGVMKKKYLFEKVN